jgi:predicted amidohydrolase YtcJ
MPPSTFPDLILHRGLFTTLDRSNPTASAVAIKEGKFAAVGHDNDVMVLAGPHTRVIDLSGRRVLPGLIDNHLHIIRGGLNLVPPPAMPDWSPVRAFWGLRRLG